VRAIRVALTRAAGRNEDLAERLRREGFEPVECPLIRIEPLGGPPIRGDDYDWLLLTSRAAVPLVLSRLEGALPRVGVVGPGTAAALREHGVEPAVVAANSTQEGLAAELPRPAGRVLFAGAEGARRLLVDELAADFMALYRTVAEAPPEFPDADLVVLASASAARAIAALGRKLPCVSIGPVTTADARRLQLPVLAEAGSPEPDILAEAVKLAASSIASSRS
jgi:uroporphyrinogen-III synthase